MSFIYNRARRLLQEVLVWLTQVQRELGDSVSDEKLRDFVWNTLQSGKVTLFCFVVNENLTLLVEVNTYQRTHCISLHIGSS